MLNLQVKDAVPVVCHAASGMETMAERIKRLRVAQGFTQEGFGKAVGVTKSAVSQWEDGSTKNIKLSTFLRVLDVLHTDANYLIWGENRAPVGGGAASKRVVRSRTGES